jgi:hypothetical protein
MQIRQLDQNLGGNIHFATFIIAINPLTAIEVRRNLGLRQVLVFPQTSYSLIHMKSPQDNYNLANNSLLIFSENIAKIILKEIKRQKEGEPMKPILEELHAGKISPDELTVPKDPQYRPLNQKIASEMKAWQSKLSETDYERLEALMDLRCQSGAMEISASFVHGFKLGALIMIEVMNGREEVVR